MKREEEIRQAARDYADVAKAYLLADEMELVRNAYEAGAEWADTHSASPWHSVADGDLPKESKGDCIIPTFLVAFRSGDIYPAYYEEDAMGNLEFYDVTESIINAECWMEIPQLPKESEVNNE